MARTTIVCFVSLVIAAVLVNNAVEGLKCYRCDTLDDEKCGREFDTTTSEVEECSGEDDVCTYWSKVERAGPGIIPVHVIHKGCQRSCDEAANGGISTVCKYCKGDLCNSWKNFWDRRNIEIYRNE